MCWIVLQIKMIWMNSLLCGILALAFFSPAACCALEESRLSTPEPLPVTAMQIKAGLHDNQRTNAPGAAWITDEQTLTALYKRLHGNILGAADDISPTILDFTREGVLFVSMGNKATAGYQVTLASKNVLVESGVASIRVNWLEPEPGEITAQVLTSPFLVLRLPKNGIKRIRILDQNMLIKAEVKIE